MPGNYPGMYMSPDEQTNFIKNYLGPRLKKAGLKTKIIVYDHNYDQYLQFPTEVTTGASEFVAGGGFHHYNNDLNAEAYLLKYKTLFPEKDIWMTECGFGTWMGDENSQFQNQMNRWNWFHVKSNRIPNMMHVLIKHFRFHRYFIFTFLSF